MKAVMQFVSFTFYCAFFFLKVLIQEKKTEINMTNLKLVFTNPERLIHCGLALRKKWLLVLDLRLLIRHVKLKMKFKHG